MAATAAISFFTTLQNKQCNMVNYPSSSTSPRLILMKSFCLLSALLFTSLNAIADDVRPYVGEDNCKVSNPYPREDERTTWTGGCKNGYAEGVGVLQWYYKDDPECATKVNWPLASPTAPATLFLRTSRISKARSRTENGRAKVCTPTRTAAP